MSINHHQEQKQTLEASKNRLELYRLEVERLRAALNEETNTRQVYGEQIRELRDQRDVLLAALKAGIDTNWKQLDGGTLTKVNASIREAGG